MRGSWRVLNNKMVYELTIVLILVVKYGPKIKDLISLNNMSKKSKNINTYRNLH